MFCGRVLACLWLLAGVACPAGAAASPPDEDFEAGWRSERWVFSPGVEFPGARGGFERSSDAAHAGQYGGRLTFDFRGGGRYVAAALQLDQAPAPSAVRFWVKSPASLGLTLRYTDQTDQTLQKSFWAPDGRWVQVLVPFDAWTGHWGGANDGKVHGPPKWIALLVERGAEESGALLLDDVQFTAGEPGSDGSTLVTEYPVFDFAEDEGWSMRVDGDAGASSWRGRSWSLDFSHGAKTISLAPRDISLLGDPSEILIRARGNAAGHPVTLQITTHFMTFEKTIGEFSGDGLHELVVAAPPSEGWRWHGGENDGQRHGPLRLHSLSIAANGQTDAPTLELVDVRVKTSCVVNRQCVMTARCEGDGGQRNFVATVRSLAASPVQGQLTHSIRDWSGTVVSSGTSAVTIPANGEAGTVTVPCTPQGQPFLEAEFVLDAADQLVPVAQAYEVASPEFVRTNERSPQSPFGMGLYLYRYGSDPASLATMDRAAALGAAAGVKWSREEFNWSRVEAVPGKYDWSFYDQMMATAKRHGISVYGLLGYWSPWTKPYTTQGMEDYCRFASAAVEHFRDDIQHWEVYNEPNIFFWQGPRDMYAELLTKAHAAIKQANPRAYVLGCSTAGIDLPFIRRTMELGAPFDILTIHPYRGQLDDRQFIADLREAAAVAKSPDGTLRPVWITEMGWATHVPHNSSTEGFVVTTQRDQACKIARTYIDAMASGVTPNVSWYDFRNDGNDPFNFEFNMGIVTDRFELKPAYRSFATLTRWLEGYHVDQELKVADSVIAYRFVADGEGPTVIAAWSTRARQEIALPASGQRARSVNLMDECTDLDVSQGFVRVAVDRDCPLLIVSETNSENAPKR